MHHAGRIRIIVLNQQTNEHLRTRSYVSVTFGFVISRNKKSLAAAAAAGRSRPGSASLYARLVGLTLESSVHVVGFVVCFLVPHFEIRHNMKTKNLQLTCFVQHRASRSSHHYYCCDIYSRAFPAAKKKRSSSNSSRTHEARVSVAVRSVCRSNP